MNNLKLVFATNNKNKLSEVKSMLTNFEIVSLSDINCYDEIPETEKTLEGNAILKANHITKKYKLSCFADDTGLEVETLDNAPGVFSARYAGKDNNSEANIQKLLNNLKGKTNRNARFRTVIALNFDNNQYLFEGICRGEISFQKQGKSGFGYDPIFIPNGYKKSFAEMDINEKGKISHRGKAIKKLVEFLNKIN